MWNILIVLIIAAVIWMFESSSLKINAENPATPLKNIGAIKSTDTSAQKSVVKSLTSEAVNEVNRAREIQQQEQDSLNNQ